MVTVKFTIKHGLVKQFKLSKNSPKRTFKQFLNWRDNEIKHGKGFKRIRNKNGEWIKVKK